MYSQLQTPLFSRPHFDFDSISHQFDAIEWREGDPVSNVEDLIQVGDRLVCLGLVLLPKEQGFQHLSSFLEELDEEDDFLVDDQLSLSISNKEFLVREFASWMTDFLRDELNSYDLSPSKAYSAFGITQQDTAVQRAWHKSCLGIPTARHKEYSFTEVFTKEVMHWLENWPVLPPNSEQPDLTERLKAYWDSH
jgi:hypothetical protein